MHRLACLMALICLLLPGRPAAAEPIAAGDRLPSLRLAAPQAPEQRAYLGLAPDADGFTLDEIRAPVVIIEIFSMYCPHCQREAPTVNRLYQMIEARPEWRDAVRLIGIGVGNSAYEVGFFKETYGIQFPLIPDGDFTVHNALGKPRTPYFLVIRIGDDRQSHLVYTHLGGFGDPEAFLDTAMTRAGMR